MNNGKYLVIGLVILIVLGLGCVENVSPKSKTDEKKEIYAKATSEDTQILTTPVPTPISTPIKKVLVEHYSKQIDKLTQYVLSTGPEYQYPSPGMTFLVINLNITNQGYPMIKINQFQWNLKVSTKDNPNAYTEVTKIFYGKEDGIECKETELENGGWTTCKIPFEVPANYDKYKIYWNEYNNVNIEWKYMPE